MERRVVIIEDERDVARLLEFNLKAAGYAVDWASTGDGGLRRRSRRKSPDVVLLDLMLPDTSGYAVCKRIRADSALADIGVLMLTAKGEPEDRIMGLEVGADDYVVKPFVVREVVLRVTALANRIAERRARSTTSTGPCLKAGTIELDPITHDVRIPASSRSSGRSSTSCSSCWSRIPAACSRARSCSSRSGRCAATSTRAPWTSTCAGCASASGCAPT